MRSDFGAVNGLIDGKTLAARLGVSPATIRSWRSRGVPWLPSPVGRLDGLVWREEDVPKVQELMPTTQPQAWAQVYETRADRLIEMPLRRARGAYYTPGDAAHFMARWIVRRPGETYLEPSLGDGVFVEAVRDVVAAAQIERPHWIASELDEETASAAVGRGLINADELRVGDFLSQPVKLVDGVIANPPFVRLRHLGTEERTSALSAAERYLGAPMALSGSVWMPFVLKMVASVKDGGRLAAVLPLDFTYVSYALPLWQHLGEAFSSIRVVRSRERVFADLNQDVLILLADGRGGRTDYIKFDAFETVSGMAESKESGGGLIPISSIVGGERAFQRALLPPGLTGLLELAMEAGWTVPASELAKFRIGYVSGNKKFFHPSEAVIKEFKLPPTSLKSSLVNSRKLRGQGLRTSGVSSQFADHLWLPSDNLSTGEKLYVKLGEKNQVDQGYKTGSRKPWYKVPGVNEPDVIITVFSEQPLVLVNDASWAATNSFLCGYLKEISADQFAQSWYNPLTLLSVELEVHSLGGGVVIMVPNEASRVQVLNPAKLETNVREIETALQRGEVSAAYRSGEKSLKRIFGSEGLELIQQGTEVLSRWRTR